MSLFFSDAYKSHELNLYILDEAVIIPRTITVSKYDFLGFSTDTFNESFGSGNGTGNQITYIPSGASYRLFLLLAIILR